MIRLTQDAVDRVISSMSEESGGGFSLDSLNLAEFSRRAGITRSQARTLKQKGFKVGPHGRSGAKAEKTVLSGYAHLVDSMLAEGASSPKAIFERLRLEGYEGGLTTVKNYVLARRVPTSGRLMVAAAATAGMPNAVTPAHGEESGGLFVMDWGRVEIDDGDGSVWRAACVTMNCACCGANYIEFFPNANLESLEIFMLHAFNALGVPGKLVVKKSAIFVSGCDDEEKPVWKDAFREFVECIGVGAVGLYDGKRRSERKSLVQEVRDSFLEGQSFENINELNETVGLWCSQLSKPGAHAHAAECETAIKNLEVTREVEMYLCPQRQIGADGYVSYEGRKFGVPGSYGKSVCRVSREGAHLHIYSDDLSTEIAVHNVTWSLENSYVKGQNILRESRWAIIKAKNRGRSGGVG